MILRAIAILALLAPPVHASCAYAPPKQVAMVVHACTTVDTAKLKAPSYGGLLLEGTRDGLGARVWVPASEKLTCLAFKPKAEIHGKLALACCDGDPNPPCLLGTGEILTAIKTT